MKGVFKHITLPAAVAAFLVAELVPLRGTQTVLTAKCGNTRA